MIRNFKIYLWLLVLTGVGLNGSAEDLKPGEYLPGAVLKAAGGCPVPSQEQIRAFWKRTLTGLSRVPVAAQVKKLKDSLPYQVFAITVQSLDRIRIAGYLSVPRQQSAKHAGFPVIVSASGYSGDQGVQLKECLRGYAILQVYPRGQGPSEKYWKPDGDKLSTHLNTPDEAYYRGGYADVIRMIDYVVSRPDIDSSHIAMVSSSQGGGIALAVAALDHRIKAVVAHVPFLCNFRMAAAMPSLVKALLDRSHNNNERSLATLDYFDPLQLADRIQIPVLMSAGGEDKTCPMATIQSVYDRIRSRKELKIYPGLKHEPSRDFYERWWPWLKSNFV
ncbi:acetylxylan esterase [Niabella aurantiaca]|uniref:acetylxylan esterase n=1 Tax=Niabella aurantiaca TaxID=379900 RepID=UPI0003802BE7|nr:acetylxylan esterase [Niabella aurantiaca]